MYVNEFFWGWVARDCRYVNEFFWDEICSAEFVEYFLFLRVHFYENSGYSACYEGKHTGGNTNVDDLHEKVILLIGCLMCLVRILVIRIRF